MSSWLAYDSQNQQMVDKFKELAVITLTEVENAFRCVNRAAFVTKELINEAFADTAIRSLPHLHMSPPHIYATVLENLELKPDISFLNIGSGTGYFSCLAGYMIKKNGINHGVELHHDLVQFSEQCISDVLKNGPIETREICPPCIIAGNCFLLDQGQMKYDRVYVGGACSTSTIKFFLGFLKVGGFLIVPNNTKLMKLQRVSENKGVKSVICSVWFAPLSRLDPYEMLMLRVGLLPKLQFPLKSRKDKPKMYVSKLSFPMGRSHARTKISKMRAIQNALDSLEVDGSVPAPFCYVPQLNQINAFKQCNALQAKMQTMRKASLSHAGGLLSNPPFASHDTDVAEFDVDGGVEYFNEEIQQQTGPGLISISLHADNAEPFVPDECDHTDKCKSEENQVCSDMWEHLCTDTLWKLVVENYYSACATTQRRREECFRLKMTETVRPATKKLADILSFQKKKSKEMPLNVTHSSDVDTTENACTDAFKSNAFRQCSSLNTDIKDDRVTLLCHPCCINCNTLVEQAPLNEKQYIPYTCVNEIDEAVKICLEELIVNVSLTLDFCEEDGHRSEGEEEAFDESIGSLLSFQSLSSSATNASLHTSFENNVKTSGSCNKKRKKKRAYTYVDIQCDHLSSENLKCVTLLNDTWTIQHDVALVSYLVEVRKESSSYCSINCKLFDKSKLIRHPLISCVSPSTLCYRSISLLRIVTILDCLLDVLIGPSLPKDQFNNPLVQETYPLKSFLDSSFCPSDSQLNVQEARSVYASSCAGDESGTSFIYQEAKSLQDQELLKEVFAIIANERNNVKQQQEILVHKLELIDNIHDQYKEQIKLLTQQIDLIEEQEQLLVEVNMMDVNYQSDSMSFSSASFPPVQQQVIIDRKKQRCALIEKRDSINKNKMSQLIERKELLSMLEQLLSLETRLNQEMMALEKKGMGYLCGEGSNLSHFSQFVSKAEQILKKLRVAGNRQQSDTAVYKKKVVEDMKNDASQECNKRETFRYQPHTILPRCRFLLPLSKKRYSYICEMLKISEVTAPKQLPIIYVDRSTPVHERHAKGTEITVFMQVYESLNAKMLDFRCAKHVDEQWWEVRFSGEGIIDQGGGFRESLVEMAEELCPPDEQVTSCLPLFIKTPNQKSKVGDHQDCYTLNPACKHYKLYVWLGKLMGACFRSDEFLTLPFPPYIWKLLVAEYVYWKKDFVDLDEAAVRNIDGLANLDEDAYIGLGIEQMYSTVHSDGSEVELKPNGCNVTVAPCERSTYSELVRKARMLESCDQVKAIREGLLSVIPEGVLSCITWEDLDNGVCGSPSITVTDLKANCRYGDDLKPATECVLHLWGALSCFTEADRSRFIRFITGRKRLPSAFVISRCLSPKDSLPSASTCGSNLFLPEYSTLEIAKEKIRYAIYNCLAIDTDTSPW